MPALIAASALRTCLGDGAQTFAALLAGRCGVGPLRHPVPAPVNVTAGYHLPPEPDPGFRASRWLSACVAEALAQSTVDATRARVVALVGTGLRELAEVEAYGLGGGRIARHTLHFGDAVRAAVPGVAEVVTISNACSASGHALALAQDLVESGGADAVVVAGTDTMTASMLAMIGRVVDTPTDRVRPFDARRTGVLLGDGAAAAVVVPAGRAGPRLATLLATGLSCDARHETAPDVEGITRAVHDAYHRAQRSPAGAALVVAHGTGTALNDPAECRALAGTVLAAGGNPRVTAVKGALGHTSGAAALVNLDVALRCLRAAVVPPVVGLDEVLPEGVGLDFVRGAPVPWTPGLAQLNAFGFGGVNAVTLVEPA